MTKIFSDYAKFYNLLYQDKFYKQEAEFVYKWANKPKTILEIGCGTGRHAEYWCKKAQKIIAIDTSKEMLNRAFKYPNIYYYNKPLEKIKFDQDVDSVFALFNVMGYYLLEECLPKLPLKPKGYFIFDVWNASKFKQQPPVPRLKYFQLGYRVAVPELISKRLVRIDYIIVMWQQVQVFERHFVQGYFKDDIEKLCKLYNYKIIDTKSTSSWQLWVKLQKL